MASAPTSGNDDLVAKQKTNPFLKESPPAAPEKDSGHVGDTVAGEKTRILQKPPPPLSGGNKERERGAVDLYQGERKTVAEQLEDRMAKNGGRLRQIEMGVTGNIQNVPGTPNEATEGRNLVPGDTPQNESSLTATAFNYINSIIGSGIIGTSFALKEAGFGLGLILLFLVWILSDYSLRLVIMAGNMSGTTSYQGLMEASFGKPGFILLSFLQFTYPFIAMVSYNVIVGDTITKLIVRFAGYSRPLSESVLASREFVILIATLLVTLPLSLYRDIDKLAKTSLVSLFFVLLILISIFVRLVTLWDVIPSTPNAWAFSQIGIPKAIGILAFAFMCHHNTFLLYSSMRDKSEQRWGRVTHISVGFSFLAIVLCSVAGYLTFTGKSEGDLMENYCWEDDLMNVSRLFFTFTILLTFPIECFVCREVITIALSSDKTPSWAKHVGLTVGVVVLVCGISMSTDCLGIVLELNGILAAVPLAFILPPLCYLRLHPGPTLTWAKSPAIALVAFGTVTSLSGVALLIANGTPKCGHGQNPAYCNSTAYLTAET